MARTAYSWQEIAEISNDAANAGAAVDAGARFDLSRWDGGTVREILLPEVEAGDPESTAQIRLRLELGRLPDELRAEVSRVLAEHEARLVSPAASPPAFPWDSQRSDSQATPSPSLSR